MHRYNNTKTTSQSKFVQSETFPEYNLMDITCANFVFNLHFLYYMDCHKECLWMVDNSTSLRVWSFWLIIYLKKFIASCNMQGESGTLTSSFPHFTFINENAQISTLNQGLASFVHIFITECLSTTWNTDVNRRLLVILATGFFYKSWMIYPNASLQGTHTHDCMPQHKFCFSHASSCLQQCSHSNPCLPLQPCPLLQHRHHLHPSSSLV